MPGVVEEGSKVATSVVGSLRQQPICLALFIICLGLIGILYIVLVRVAEFRRVEFDALMAQHKEVQALLSKCSMPGGRL